MGSPIQAHAPFFAAIKFLAERVVVILNRAGRLAVTAASFLLSTDDIQRGLWHEEG